MDIQNIMGLPYAGGVLTLLLWVGGVVAMERGSEQIETRDLLKAIYVVDLEHVLQFWTDWEAFENIVAQEKLVNGASTNYINRVLYLVRIYVASNEGGGILVRPSRELEQITSVAQRFASEREESTSPTSRDVLFSICSVDTELSTTLQRAGLQLNKLEEAIRPKR